MRAWTPFFRDRITLSNDRPVSVFYRLAATTRPAETKGPNAMRRTAMIALLIASPLALAGCNGRSGPAASGLSSSAPNAVSDAAGGTTGGGDNKFTKAQVTPGTPAGANLGLTSPQP